MVYLETQMNLMCLSLDGVRKPEYPTYRKSDAYTGSVNGSQEPSCCEAMALTTTVQPSMKVKESQGLLWAWKTNRDIGQTLGLPKSTVWSIIKKKECTGELCNRKGTGRPRKIFTADDRRILLKKNPQTPVQQISHSLQEADVSLSETTIHWRLHEQKYRGYPARRKPLVSLKNRMTRLQFMKKYLKEPAELWCYGQTRPRLNSIRVMATRKCGDEKELPKIQSTSWSVKHDGGIVVPWAYMAVDGSCTMTPEVYGNICLSMSELFD